MEFEIITVTDRSLMAEGYVTACAWIARVHDLARLPPYERGCANGGEYSQCG